MASESLENVVLDSLDLLEDGLVDCLDSLLQGSPCSVEFLGVEGEISVLKSGEWRCSWS